MKYETQMSLVVCINCPKTLSEHDSISLASYVFSISKTPGIKSVCVYGHSSPILDKLPRSLGLIEKPLTSSFYEAVFDTCKKELLPTDLVLVISQLKDLVLPEALQCAALALRKTDYAFFREFLPQTMTKVEFIDARHWMLGVPAQNIFMTRVSTLIQDNEEFRLSKTQEMNLSFDVLSILKHRVLASPVPSLSCPLPLSTSDPPLVPWKQVQELVKNLI